MKTNYHISIVEDDLFFANLIQETLKDQGFLGSEIYTNPWEFLSCNDPKEIIILDHHFTDVTGIDVLKKLKGINPNTQIIYLSGQEKMSIAITAIKYGAFDYIEKSTSNLKKLPGVIKKVIEHKKTVVPDKVSLFKRSRLFKLFF